MKRFGGPLLVGSVFLLAACSGMRTGPVSESERPADAATTVGQPEPVITEPGDQALPELSHDGRWLAYQSNSDGNWELYLAHADGSQPLRITSTNGSEEGPLFSPDDQWIVFTYTDNGRDPESPRDIWRIRRDGTEREQLTHDPADDWAPMFHPVTGDLIFVSDRGHGEEALAQRHRELYRLSFADGTVTPLFPGESFTDPGVASGHGWLARTPEQQVVQFDSLDHRQQSWPPPAGLLRFGSVSLLDENRLVLFGMQAADLPRVYVYHRDGRVDPLTPENTDARFPVVGSNYVYFTSLQSTGSGEEFDIYRIPIR